MADKAARLCEVVAWLYPHLPYACAAKINMGSTPTGALTPPVEEIRPNLGLAAQKTAQAVWADIAAQGSPSAPSRLVVAESDGGKRPKASRMQETGLWVYTPYRNGAACL